MRFRVRAGLAVWLPDANGKRGAAAHQRRHLLHKDLSEGGRPCMARHGAIEDVGRRGVGVDVLRVWVEGQLCVALQVDGREEHLASGEAGGGS